MDVDESSDDRDEERTGALHRASPIPPESPLFLLQALQVKRDGTTNA